MDAVAEDVLQDVGQKEKEAVEEEIQEENDKEVREGARMLSINSKDNNTSSW